MAETRTQKLCGHYTTLLDGCATPDHAAAGAPSQRLCAGIPARPWRAPGRRSETETAAPAAANAQCPAFTSAATVNQSSVTPAFSPWLKYQPCSPGKRWLGSEALVA